MNLDYFKKSVFDIFLVDSPSGFCQNINKVLIDKFNEIGITDVKVTNKGNIRAFVKGESSEKKIGIAAHADTLGLMVRSINSDGTLKVTNVGGPSVPTLDGEYCKIVTRDNKVYTGTILSTSPAAHVFKDHTSKERNIDNMVVRIDEVVKNKNDVLALGINNGDYVCYDPKTVITESGFLKSRFIDDKASVCIILSVLEYMMKNNIKPKYDLCIYFTNYEEVGHGAASINDDLYELLAIDMGCVGLDLAGNEYACCICAKDSSGPYNYDFTNKLINIAKDNKLNYIVDIFPFYSSDASAALRGGADIRAALIGTGVNASHGMERTHLDGINNTMELLFNYLTK